MEKKEYFGFGSINNLKKILQRKKASKIFLVTGKKSFESCGAKKSMNSILKNYKVKKFNQFSPNPKLDEIKKGLEAFKESDPDIIIAVGGGSAIDTAKAIKLLSNKKIPLVAIPTTSGSGSEATHFVVYYIGKEKQSKGKTKITLPDYSICDPQFIMSLPKKITASTGIDALSQAVESYWSINSTPRSKKFAKKAIKLLIENLEKAVNSPSKKAKKIVMRAANLAGKAINITKTTACHALAYSMTSYFDIPHGHATGLTLGEMLIYNYHISDINCQDKRGSKYVKKTTNELIVLIGEKNPYNAKNTIESLMKNIGLEVKLSKLQLKEKDIDIIIKSGFNPERVKNNPRILTEKNLRTILNNIY